MLMSHFLAHATIELKCLVEKCGPADSLNAMDDFSPAEKTVDVNFVKLHDEGEISLAIPQ